MMKSKYPLEWLDNLILERLNPNRADLSQMSEDELAAISEDAAKESKQIQVRIKNEIFALRRKRQIRLLVRKYHSTLIFLLDRMSDSQKSIIFQSALISKCGEAVIGCLDGLLSFLEQRYSGYLSLDEKVPITYLLVSRKELQLKLNSLQKRKSNSEEMQEALKVVAQELGEALSLQSRSRVTFRQVLYERTLLNGLAETECLEEGLFSALDRKLIGLNFNSPAYISLLERRIVSKMEAKENFSEKAILLSLYFKEFSQIYCSDKLFFNAGLQPVKTVLENWFKHELGYLEKQAELAIVLNAELSSEERHKYKLECDLSADQIAIILRAADEARIVKSRSMSLVFQRIVPHLSTAFKKDLSYQSVRSKSYNAEENDKNIAILTLEKMIRKIRSY
ncbi:hypothetical protein OD917_05340 [Flavobacterium sp. SH_e]|uniref:hypothetical protein n=1 Tax=Flavobacterium TaxID=237 RepID=UPI0021E35A89|nr:hypothetical protein [Flavobacterium sp. SH_e]MCV2484335.1 hypothetical protein [Flavobacterium sp. SH_e]